MKKKVIIIVSIIVLVLVMLLLVFSTNSKKMISKNLGVTLDSCKIVKEKDTHKGFMGDGDYFAKLECTSSIDTSKWKKLPCNKMPVNNR